jgi:hypothetical protein
VLERFVWRGSLDVIFEDTRRQLGVETQRQWSALAMMRRTSWAAPNVVTSTSDPDSLVISR